MGERSSSGKTDKSGVVSRSTGGRAIKVDPAINRPSNSDETSPETLIPDIVRVDRASEAVDQPTRDRESRIAERAYQLAQQRGFAPGAELEDWLQAEREIDAQPIKQTPPEDQFTG
ncbi:MAG: DUF2934 domain-containing protein [Steroidobacter sp.]